VRPFGAVCSGRGDRGGESSGNPVGEKANAPETFSHRKICHSQRLTLGFARPRSTTSSPAPWSAGSGVEGWRPSPSTWRISKNAARLAIELGHTKQSLIFSHYRELVTEEEANRYWNIFPARTALNVVPMVISRAFEVYAIRYDFNWSPGGFSGRRAASKNETVGIIRSLQGPRAVVARIISRAIP
jgi:hypothetical protein